MEASHGGLAEWRRHWPLPIAAALGYSTTCLQVYAIGPFIEPLQQAFGWSRAQASIGLTVVQIASAALSVPMGMLVDRVGPRRVALVGVVVTTAAFALLSTATGAFVNWLLLWGGVACGNIWLLGTTWTSAVASRFERSRGLAFAVTLAGASVAAMVLPILATASIARFGWRGAFIAIALAWAALVLPALYVFFRSARDGPRGARGAAAPVQAPAGASVRDGLRSAAFYRLLVASGPFMFIVMGVVVHFVPLLTDAGAERSSAAGVAALIGVFSLVGRLGAGVLLDRFPGHLVGAAVFLAPLGACAFVLVGGAEPLAQAAAAACLGVAVGAEIDVIAYLASRHFGLKNFGVLFGAIMMALALGSAFGPLAAGASYDAFGDYRRFLILGLVLLPVSSLALVTLGRPRHAW